MSPLLSIIVPTYNEERTIARIVARLTALPFQKGALEIIVVNDGSTDSTEKAVQPFLPHIRYFSNKHNQGKGAALRAGLARARGRYAIVQDADAEYAPEEIPELLATLQKNTAADAVYGSRNLTPTGRGYRHYVLGAWFLTKCVNAVFRTRLTDMYTCYKLMRTDLFRSLNLASNGFEIEMEITARLLKNKKKIIEMPISYAPRPFKEGKKIRPRDGLRGLATLLRIVLE